ncbi:hypothetical protein EU522_00965, partial [Candidatus Thorarchaeota archaeon]
MKRVLTVAFIVLMVLVTIPDGRLLEVDNAERGLSNTTPLQDSFANAAAGGNGNAMDSALYMSRTFTNLETSMLNTYASPDTHSATIDLAGFLESGWTLDRATLSVKNITAEVEREIVGNPSSPVDSFRTFKITGLNIFQNALTQRFYVQPHNGKLMNYSVNYKTFG